MINLASIKTAGIAAGVAFAVGFGSGLYVYSLRVPSLLESQKKADAKACKAEQDKTKEANDALVKDRDRIARDAARYKRLHPNTCLYPAGEGKLQPVAGEHAGVHGISTDWLRDYAAVCETLRSELAVCIGQ